MASFESSTYFSKEEFDHPDKMDQRFIAKLDVARGIAQVPFKINSDYREDSKAHYNGRGVDISATDSKTRFAIVRGAIRAGINRIGVYDRHVHLDDEQEPTHPERVMWIGKSK
jgi:hypothetical protein